jgi:hypothetical protein
MDGSCDVKGCDEPTFMCWRPLTERLGRQICEKHFRRHDNKNDSFDLYDEFKFKRFVKIQKPSVTKDVPRCACGRERLPGHKFCEVCAKERERKRKRQYYRKKKSRQVEPVVEKNNLQCKQCGEPRLPGHSYCLKCSQRRSKQSNRERQRRHYRKSG